MIKRILIVFLACLTLYSSFIFLLSVKKMRFGATQNLWQENVKRMQDYVYSDKWYGSLILGSSLSMRILIDEDDPEFFNLAAGGGDPFIGFEIIKRSKRVPSRIYVESNSLLTKTTHDDTYLSTIYRPGFFQLRKYVPALKEQYQPVNFLGQSMLYVIRRFSELTADSSERVQERVDPVVLKNARKAYDPGKFVEGKKAIEGNLAVLQTYLDYFKKRGVQVIFFEMPKDCKIQNSLLSNYSRSHVSRIAEQNRLSEIPLPACEDFFTSDGVHLTPSSAVVYTKYFFEQIKRIDGAKRK